jgi:hypothetical protein
VPVRKSLPAVALVVVAGLFLTGCSRSLAADDIERKLEQELSSEDFVPDVSCDDDLEGDEGATITCSTTLANGDAADIVVTATNVSGDQVEYTWLVQPVGDGSDDAPTEETPTAESPSSDQPPSDQPAPTTTMPTM